MLMGHGHGELHVEGPARVGVARATGRVLIVEPDADIRELLVERCRRFGLEPVADGLDEQGRLPEADLIVAEPASPRTQAVLAAHRAQQSRIPIVFVSIYPPANGVLRSSAVAYLVLPCSSEDFERALSKALSRGAARA